LYTTGDALSLGVAPEHLDALIAAVDQDSKLGEVGIYAWGVHIGWTKEAKRWDKRTEPGKFQFLHDLLSNDKMKNWMLIAAAAVAGWFFFLRKK